MLMPGKSDIRWQFEYENIIIVSPLLLQSESSLQSELLADWTEGPEVLGHSSFTFTFLTDQSTGYTLRCTVLVGFPDDKEKHRWHQLSHLTLRQTTVEQIDI